MAQDIRKLIDSLKNQPLGKTYKEINKIVSNIQNSFQTEAEILGFVDLLNFEDSHERLVKLHLINKFNIVQYVVPILKSEDIHLIKVALKFHWFFEGTNIVNAKDFIDSVFPHASIVVQRKILNQFAMCLKNEFLAQEFFCIIKERRGVSQASCLLPACGADFFQKFINESHLDTPPHILLKVLHKYPSLIVLQVEKILKRTSEKNNYDVTRSLSKYREILRKLAQYYPDMFCTLYEKNKTELFFIHVGRRSCRKFIQVNKDAVVKSPNDYVSILQHRKLYKNFSPDEFKTIYAEMFPKKFPAQSDNLETHVDHLFSLLNNMQPALKREYIFSAFVHAYGQHLLEHPKLISEKLLMLLSAEDRIKVAEAKVKLCSGNENSDDYKWICYYETERSIPMIKELLIEAADVNTRASLVPLLVRTCSINEDFSALKDVCEYFTNRFRNDDVSVRSAFMRRLSEDYRIQELSDEHWKYIDELIQIFVFNNEFIKVNDLIIDLLEESIIHGISKQGNVLTHIHQFVKALGFKNHPEQWTFFTRIVKHDKNVLIKFFQNWVDAKLSFTGKLLYGVTTFLVKLIKSWNTKHCNDRLSVSEFPVVVDYITQSLATAKDSLITVLISNLEEDLPARDILYTLLFPMKPESKIVMHYLRYNLSTLVENWDAIAKYILENKSVKAYHMFFTKVKMFKVQGMFDTTVSKCKNIIQNQPNDAVKCKAIHISSLLLNSTDFHSVVSHYYPNNEKVDFFAEGSQEIFDIQKTVATCFKYVKPVDDLHIMIPFCAGDYLKLVLKSLNDICLNTAETRVIPFLHILSEKPVSVRKHSVRFFCKILSYDDSVSCLARIWQSSKHPSIRRVILDQLLRMMHEDPSDSTWQLLKSCISALTADDKKSLELFTSLDKIPRQYKSEYFLLCWNTMIRIEKEGKKVFSPRPALLKLLTREMFLSIEDKFFHDLLNEHMFVSDSLLKHSISTVCAQYIFYSPTNELLESRLSHVMTLFKNIVDSSWDTFDLSQVNPYPARKVLSGFVRDFCTESTKFEEADIDKAVIFQKFLTFWKSVLTPKLAFGDYILLELYNQYYSLGKEKGRTLYAEKLIALFEQILKEYSEAYVPLIIKKLGVVTSYAFHSLSTEETEKELELLEKLIKSKGLSLNVMIILNMFNNLSYDVEARPKFRNILCLLHSLTNKENLMLNLMLERWVGEISGY